MKNVWRIVVILAAALIVAGILITLRQTGVLEGALSGWDRARSEAGSARERFAPGGFEHPERSRFVRDGFERGHHAEREPDARGIIEVVKNLLIIGIIIALVVGASLIARRFLQRRAPPRTPSEPSV